MAEHETVVSVAAITATTLTNDEISLLPPLVAPDVGIKLFKSAEAKLVK